MVKKVFITDCEGPLTLNDNAYELADEFKNYSRSSVALMITWLKMSSLKIIMLVTLLNLLFHFIN